MLTTQQDPVVSSTSTEQRCEDGACSLICVLQTAMHAGHRSSARQRAMVCGRWTLRMTPSLRFVATPYWSTQSCGSHSIGAHLFWQTPHKDKQKERPRTSRRNAPQP